MSASQSPLICVTCRRAFPEDLAAKTSPRYFAQENLLPRSDEDISFGNEAQRILSYIETVSYVTRYATELEDEHYQEIMDLIHELSEEAKRRLDIADAAMREIWERDHGYEPLTRKEGV